MLVIKWAVGKAVRAGRAVGGNMFESMRDRRATQPPAHFHRNPPGRGPVGCFSGCSLDPYDSHPPSELPGPAYQEKYADARILVVTVAIRINTGEGNGVCLPGIGETA